jgi:hypothetical protein
VVSLLRKQEAAVDDVFSTTGAVHSGTACQAYFGVMAAIAGGFTGLAYVLTGGDSFRNL